MAAGTRFDRLVRRMERTGVAARGELAGCSAREVARLEARYGVRLPATFRRYLEVMGHNPGRLFASDHLSAGYPSVLTLTAGAREDWRTYSGAEGGPPRGFRFPADGLIVATRMGLEYLFIRCHRPDDSGVWHYDDDWRVRLWHRSVVGWLEQWCGEAVRAGFFDRHPGGPTPGASRKRP